MRANCNRLVSVVYLPNTQKVAGSRPARNIVNTFCSHLLSSFYKGLLCRNAWLIFSYALFRIFLSRLTNIIHVIVYFVFSFNYLKKFYAFETSRLRGFHGCLHFLLDKIVVTAHDKVTLSMHSCLTTVCSLLLWFECSIIMSQICYVTGQRTD